MTTRRPVTDVERRAYEMRRAAMPIGVIAQQLHVSERRVKLMVQRVIDQLPQDHDTRLDIDRLDRLIAAAWPRAIAGDGEMMDRVAKLTAQRNRLGNPHGENRGELLSSFETSIDRARRDKVVSELDSAIVESGRKLAKRIDEALSFGDPEEATKAMYLIPHLMNILKECMATPGARHRADVKAGADETPKGGVLRSLRDGDAEAS